GLRRVPQRHLRVRPRARPGARGGGRLRRRDLRDPQHLPDDQLRIRHLAGLRGRRTRGRVGACGTTAGAVRAPLGRLRHHLPDDRLPLGRERRLPVLRTHRLREPPEVRGRADRGALRRHPHPGLRGGPTRLPGAQRVRGRAGPDGADRLHRLDLGLPGRGRAGGRRLECDPVRPPLRRHRVILPRGGGLPPPHGPHRQDAMAVYILRRLLAGLVLALLITLITFLLRSLSFEDVVRTILGQSANEESVAAMTAQLGYDRPVLVQYADWLGSLLQGDLGRSVYT